MKKYQILEYPKCAQQRLFADCSDIFTPVEAESEHLTNQVPVFDMILNFELAYPITLVLNVLCCRTKESKKKTHSHYENTPIQIY